MSRQESRSSQDARRTPDNHDSEPSSPPEAGFLGRAIVAGGRLFAICLIAAMAILNGEVLLRYLFNSPTIWAHEATIFLCAVTFVYGGLYCTARNSHIRVVLLYDQMKGHYRKILDALISVVCAVSSGLFAWASWLMVERAVFRPDGSIRLETSGSAWNPPTPALLKLFLLLVLTLMAVQFAVLAVNHARQAKTRR